MNSFNCTLSREEHYGWQGIRLSNGIVDLFVVPELGGRIIQLRFGSHEFFYVNQRHRGKIYSHDENCIDAGWKNYGGSKVWPAPQGWENKQQWPGPPDPILDGGPYSCRALETGPHCAAIYIESLPDDYTGLTFSREIRLFRNQSTVEILHKMRNSTSRRVRWAIWQVTQQAVISPLYVYVPARSYLQVLGDRLFDNAVLDAENALWKLQYANQVAKFTVDADQGWLAVLKPGEQVALVETFPLFPGKFYPGGAPLAFWVNGEGTLTLSSGQINMGDDPDACDPFLETEILSPLTELNPGQEYSFPVTWHATALPFPAMTKLDSCALISEPIAVKLADQKLHLEVLPKIRTGG